MAIINRENESLFAEFDSATKEEQEFAENLVKMLYQKQQESACCNGDGCVISKDCERHINWHIKFSNVHFNNSFEELDNIYPSFISAPFKRVDGDINGGTGYCKFFIETKED